MLIWGLLMVQPAFSYFGGKAAYRASVCTKEKPVKSDCSKKKSCDKPDESKEDNKCRTDGCNPTLGCPSGNFYVHHHHQISIPSLFLQKLKLLVSDDNRIIKNLSECWHPPEA